MSKFDFYSNNPRNADLHMHSSTSIDADDSIKHIIKKCEGQKTTIMAITDHNTIIGANDYLDRIGVDRLCTLSLVTNKVIMVPGVEITARISEITNIKGNSAKIHLLAYGIDRSDNSPISKLLEIKRINDIEVDLGMLFQLIEHFNLDITKSEIAKFIKYKKTSSNSFHSLTKNDILEFVKFFNLKLTNSEEELRNIIDTFRNTDRLNLDAKDVINLVHASGGIVVLAHPYQNLRRTTQDKEIINFLIQHEIDGFEIYYPQNVQSCDTMIRNLCKDNKINIFTGGSDFHGEALKTFSEIYIPYKPIEISKIQSFLEYMNKIEHSRAKGTLIIKNYTQLKDVDTDKILKKYKHEFLQIQNLNVDFTENFN